MEQRSFGAVARLPDSPRRVVVVAFPQAKLLDVAGPCEVFAVSNQFACAMGAAAPYEIVLISARAGPVETDTGIDLVASCGYAECHTPIDTLLVAAGPDVRVSDNTGLIGWLRQVLPQVRRVGSICTGAFVLAALGLLDGRRATTHWAWCQRLADDYPQIQVDPDPIFVRDGNISTSAGISAGMDLALALVEEDLGSGLALRVAQQMVLFLRRPGSQSQFSALLDLQAADRQPLRDLQGWIVTHLSEDLSVEALAKRFHMSPRNFARVFQRSLGQTPARFVERLRIEAARQRLVETEAGLDQIARECGFGSADVLRRAFVRLLQVNPSDYRRWFGSGAANPDHGHEEERLATASLQRQESDL